MIMSKQKKSEIHPTGKKNGVTLLLQMPMTKFIEFLMNFNNISLPFAAIIAILQLLFLFPKFLQNIN